MAEAVQKIGRKDIEKFIVQHMYGENASDWPRATIVLCTVEIYYTKRSSTSIKDCKLTIKAVYRNDHSSHAEGYFLSDLGKEMNTLLDDEETTVTTIQANLVQNYSPCRNCADEILEFKEDTEKQNINVSLTIKFANFYLHKVESNRKGLRELLGKGVELELLRGEDGWEEFLKNLENLKNLVDLTEDEYNELRKRAKSKKRKEREEKDVEMLNEIESEASEEEEKKKKKEEEEERRRREEEKKKKEEEKKKKKKKEEEEQKKEKEEVEEEERRRRREEKKKKEEEEEERRRRKEKKKKKKKEEEERR